MNAFDVTVLETEEATAFGWTVAGVAAGVGVAALACD